MTSRLSLKARALQLLAQREQSSVELRRKLTRHAAAADRDSRRDAEADATSAAAVAGAGRDDEVDIVSVSARVEDVLGWLRANQFASDERFVESRVNARWSRFGNLRIRDELSRHGVAADAALSQRLDDSELHRAQQVWSAKFTVAPGDAAAQARQYRFLAGRGFSPEVIRRVIRQAIRDAAAAPTSPATSSPSD